MNRSLIYILAISVCIISVARPAEAQRFLGGLVGGFNLSQIDGDKLAGFNQIGLNAGARVAAIINERWQLSLELLFSQQGSSRTPNDDLSSIYDHIRTNFVEAPVLINFIEWKFHISGGFSYARLINFTAVDFTGEDISDNQNFNPGIFSFIVGATFYFNEHSGLNLRWSKYINDLQAGQGAQKLIGRTVAIRGIYMF